MITMRSPAGDAWHPEATSDTTLTSYWLNWRFFLCTLWVMLGMTFASILIWKNEGRQVTGENDEYSKLTLYSEETWRPCFKSLHPLWLLVFRCLAFFFLLVLLVYALFISGPKLLYYYTQWTFTLVTLYFAVQVFLIERHVAWLDSLIGDVLQIGVLLSVHGCLLYRNNSKIGKVMNEEASVERGQYEGISSRFNHPADNLAYVFQIMYQVNAGAVMLTDCVFWFVIFPFLESNDYGISTVNISMHSMNAVLLMGDALLNSMRFPSFRIGYFFLWTIVYVLFMWVVHSCFHIWWPYPFLDLSSSYSPLWYFVVGVLHFPCYGMFALILRFKHILLSKWFPHSYECLR